MKISAFIFLIACAMIIHGQVPSDCIFPFYENCDSALVKVWLASKPSLDAVQVEKIKQKRAS